jgi:phosphatidylglycerol:prolipoprotein diacylglycerol transferase
MVIIPAQNDIAFNLFGISVYWYGIILAFAIFFALICANKLFNRVHPDLKKDIIIEFAPLIIILGILCARLYFCLLNPHYYFTHPLEIFDIREGGLSIHGAIIGGILSILFIVKKYRLNFLTVIDPIACSTFLGQAIGRWGNYFNSEAYGYPVASQNWGLFIPQSRRLSGFSQYDLFHPTFLYESILDLLSFIILVYVYKRFGKEYRGLVFFSYLILYALIRFFVEKIRIDSALYIASVPIAQIVSIVLFVIGLIGIICIKKFQK